MEKARLKVDKSFKGQVFIEVRNIVINNFPAASMDADNVENHMRTMKQKYQEIKKVLGLSGVGWNEELKIIVLEDDAYCTYVEAYPKAKELLNKPIPLMMTCDLSVGMIIQQVSTYERSSTSLVVKTAW
ncbi:hypothetical protein J5N97_030209 [Dioscorea zingiberensis]|uniref:Myb/SANT-like domain-containing protein n=1 Tax=Dioscorea zingiberensis TaxID=325984 RepID=A0A9D5BXI8_9LILI|nr:hypothetical protein J5N97_030209 [Dioscorea zingiberensis]